MLYMAFALYLLPYICFAYWVLNASWGNSLFGNGNIAFSTIKFLRMNFLDKIIELPKISIKQLERKARISHSHTAHYPTLNKQNTLHAKAIILVSPFHPKLHSHPPKFECRSHRLKKTQQPTLKEFKSRQDMTQSTILQDKLSQQKGFNGKQPPLRPYTLNANRIGTQFLKPLGLEKPDSLTLLKYQKSKLQISRSDSQRKLFQPLASSFANQLSWRKHKKIDTSNAQFIAAISRRLQNDKYKSSYLKTLFGFMKMKASSDSCYMWNSKAYLANSLNLLLNHFSMQKLVKVDQLQDYEIQKIGFYMGCQSKQVKSILLDLANAVAQMENFLAQFKRKRETGWLRALGNAGNALDQDYQFANYSGFLSYEISADSLTILMDSQKNNSNNFSKTTPKVEIVISEQNESEIKRLSTKGSLLNLRTSTVKFPLEYASTAFKTLDGNLQNQEKVHKEAKQLDGNLSNRLLGNLGAKKRSNRSNVFATIDECRREQRQSSNKLKKSKQSKSRKIKIWKSPALNDYDEKYWKIKYQKFCSKKDFSHLIQQIQRLDQNDQERAKKIFNLLNVEQFLDDADKIDQLTQTFNPLFNPNIKEKFLKMVVLVKDRKYIDKLSAELDFILNQVKRTDSRHFNNQDLCPYKEDPILKNSCNQRIIRCRYSRQEHSQVINLKAIKLMKITQNNELSGKVAKNRFTQDEKELAQADLDEIRVQPLESIELQSFYDDKAKKDKVFIQTEDKVEQKKILQYMHQKHHSIFNCLSSQIATVCSKLAENEKTL